MMNRLPNPGLCRLVFVAGIVLCLGACQSSPKPKVDGEAIRENAEILDAELESAVYEIPVVISSKIREAIPPDTRVVIADLEGDCGTEVKDALMRRLIENSEYTVLTRDNLGGLIDEADFTWSGRVDTRTATRLGNLLGASVFIVGRVVYCGFAVEEDTKVYGDRFSILAMLRIIDLETGKAIFASSNEGDYTPGAEQFSLAQFIARTRSGENRLQSLWEQVQKGMEAVSNVVDPLDGLGNSMSTEEVVRETEPCLAPCGVARYLKLRAAEDMANSFADQFFARPTWERVEMWRNSAWHYTESVRYVRLGYCPRAVEFMREIASRELDLMPDKAIAEYLHNYGVALLCSDRLQESLDKLRASYRIAEEPSTLRMIGLASRMEEWTLRAEIDREPETKLLADRIVQYQKRATGGVAVTTSERPR